MHYELCIMNCFRAFRLSPPGFPLYLCSLNFSSLKKNSKFPKSRPRIPFLVPLAKDAAAIPNALAATSNERRAVSKVTEPVEVTNLCLRQAQAPFMVQCSQPIAHRKKKFRVQSSNFLVLRSILSPLFLKFYQRHYL